MVVSGFAMSNQEATTVTKMLIDNWISRFGVSMGSHLNQGRNFESNLFQRVTEVLATQSDGMVEW